MASVRFDLTETVSGWLIWFIVEKEALLVFRDSFLPYSSLSFLLCLKTIHLSSLQKRTQLKTQPCLYQGSYTGCPVTVLRFMNCEDSDSHVVWITILRTVTGHPIYDPNNTQDQKILSSIFILITFVPTVSCYEQWLAPEHFFLSSFVLFREYRAKCLL